MTKTKTKEAIKSNQLKIEGSPSDRLHIVGGLESPLAFKVGSFVFRCACGLETVLYEGFSTAIELKFRLQEGSNIEIFCRCGKTSALAVREYDGPQDHLRINLPHHNVGIGA